MRLKVRRIGNKPANDKTFEKRYKPIRLVMKNKVAPWVTGYPDNVTANWTHKPRWVKKIFSERKGITLQVYAYGKNKKIWKWVSRGTRPHKIRPKNAKALAFPTGYIPRTKPSGPSYGGLGKATGPTIFAMEVDHPGNKPRNFEKAWVRWAKPRFKSVMKAELRRLSRKR